MSATVVPLAATDSDRIAIAIDRHVTATSTTLARVFAGLVASLDEPRAHPRFARQHLDDLLDDLVETLLRVAAGAVFGRVVSSVLRSFGTECGFRLELPLREALRDLDTPGEISPGQALPLAPSSLVDNAASRPLAAELGLRLFSRLADAGRGHRAVLARLAIAAPAGRALAFATTLAQLDDDPLLATLWAEHLHIAWRYFTFAVTDRREADLELPPALARGTSRTAWQAWLRRARGEAAPALPTTPPDGEDITPLRA